MRKWLVVLAVVLGACGDKDPTGPDSGITGVYTLETINNQPMPVALLSFLNVYILAQIGGTLTLNADMSYEERANLREAFFDENANITTKDTTVVVRGIYEVEDSAIVLDPNPGYPQTILIGLVSRATLTLNFEASNDSLFTYFYRRNANGGAVAGRPHVNYLISSSPSIIVSGSTTRLLTTTSSITGRRSTTTSSDASRRVSSTRVSTARASISRASPTTAAGSSE